VPRFIRARGEIFNLGGGSEVALLNAIKLVEKVSGRQAKLKRFDRQLGDVRHTSARLDQARSKLGYDPKVGLEQGLAAQWQWICSLKG
jgi:UDP-glucose 4-epimerase